MSTSRTHPDTLLAHTDVLIVGAGIVGLAHAAEAHTRGLTVAVIDRDARAVGASIRNFGHCCVTAQSGELLDLAQVARERWLHYANRAGFFATPSGALAVARRPEEVDVLEELAASREEGQVRMVGADVVQAELGTTADPHLLGGAILRDDVRVDPREAVGALATWLAAQDGVTFFWNTSYLGSEGDLTQSSRGGIRATETFICVGHDVDLLFPDVAGTYEIVRCGLQMTLVEAPGARRIRPAVLTGTSMLRYPAFTEVSASPALVAAIAQEDTALVDIGANVMFTQRPDGRIIAGDSHRYGRSMDPFQSETTTQVLLDRIAAILGVPQLAVSERWQGINASSALQPYVVHEVAPGITIVSVTSGVGMTISFGLARKVFEAR